MKKVLAGIMMMGAIGMTAQASPRGTVEIGFENEKNSSTNKKSDMILPYVKTKTFFNETTPYYVEANYSFRHQHEKDSGDRDKRQRYELFFGGYSLATENFAFTPKIGFRHEEFSNVENGTANRTIWRVYPNMSYKINDTNSVSLSGFIAPISTNRSGESASGDVGGDYDKEYTDYLHELELGHTYRLNDHQSLTTSIYNEYEKNHYVRTAEIWELRFRFNHAMENGKTTISPFTRLPINRESRTINESGRYTEDTNRIRIGVAGSHKVSDDWTMLGEVYYQNTTSTETSSGSTKASNDLYFLKLAMRYSY